MAWSAGKVGLGVVGVALVGGLAWWLAGRFGGVPAHVLSLRWPRLMPVGWVALILGFMAAVGIVYSTFLERTLYTMVNEGALILEEKMAQRSSDIDVVWIYGYGWPVYRGGPMFWADTEGLQKIVEGLDKHGFKVSALLREKAETGGRFS